MRACVIFLVIPWLLAIGFNVSDAMNLSDAKALRYDIFVINGYDYRLRPIQDQGALIGVYVSFYLLALNSLDEVSEVMKTTGYLYVNWFDQELTWSPMAYGGINSSFWPQDDVWRPDIALKNSAVRYMPLGDPTLNVYVDASGAIIWQPFQVFESTCSISIRYFPFDIQTCSLVFVAWSYTKDEVYLFGDIARGIDLSGYQNNSAWELIDSSWSADSDSLESSITFTIKLKRKPLYVLLSIVLPVLLLTILNIFTFALPCEGGEKSGYSVTIFLAFAVFLTIVEQTLPANSESVAFFSIYVIMMTLMSTLITIITLVECRAISWDSKEKPVPKWLRYMVRLSGFLCCKRGCSRRNNKIHDNSTDKVGGSKMDLKSVDDDVSASDVQGGEEEMTWISVISSLDVVFFGVFMLYAVLGNILFLLIASTATK